MVSELVRLFEVVVSKRVRLFEVVVSFEVVVNL